jgi:hypothetical protein
MKSLKNIYENSNFYKEARIVSFIDRLLLCMTQKIKDKININSAIAQGKVNYDDYTTFDINHAKSILQKFQEVTLKFLNFNIL